MTSKQNYYITLDLDKDATEEQIKTAYRKLVKTYHPDAHKNDPSKVEKFKEIQEAYEVLGDSDRRARYDQVQSGSPAISNFGDIFSSWWQAGTTATMVPMALMPQQGYPIEITIEVPIVDLFKEHITQINLTRVDNCPACSGNGTKSGMRKNVCTKCNGTGHVHTKETMMHGSYRMMFGGCPECGGQGIKNNLSDVCEMCKGIGTAQNKVELPLKIPAGMPNVSKRLVLFGQGNVGRYGGNRGDVYVVLKHPSNSLFSRYENKPEDLLYKAEIPYWKAVLGGTIEIPHPQFPITLKVPTKCQCNHVECVRGAGLPVFGRHSDMGDLHVSFSVAVLSSSQAELELIMKLKELNNDDKENSVKRGEGSQSDKNWEIEKEDQEDQDINENPEAQKGYRASAD